MMVLVLQILEEVQILVVMVLSSLVVPAPRTNSKQEKDFMFQTLTNNLMHLKIIELSLVKVCTLDRRLQLSYWNDLICMTLIEE